MEQNEREKVIFVANSPESMVALTTRKYEAFDLNQEGGPQLFLHYQNVGRQIILAFDQKNKGEEEAEEWEKLLEKEGLIVSSQGRYLCRGFDTLAKSCEDNEEEFRTRQEETVLRSAEAFRAREADLLKTGDIRQPQNPIDAFLEEIQGRRFEPIPTGIKDLDRALDGGFIRRTLVTLGAAPGAGKTAMAQYIFENMASAGHDVLFINLEMDRSQLLARSISRIAWKLADDKARKTVPLSALDIMRGYEWAGDPERRKVIEAAADEYRRTIAPHFVYNPDSLGNSSHLDRIIESMERETARIKAAGRPEPIICIDYLQIIGTDKREPAEAIKTIIDRLKHFAVENNTVVFLITAQNRAANRSGESTMESSRDTSAIEYTGDLMLGLVYTAIEDHRKYTYYEKDENGNTVKNKNGEPKKITEEYTLDKIRELRKIAGDEHRDPDAVCNELTLKILKNRFGESERRAKFIFDGKHGIFQQVEYKHQQPTTPTKLTPGDYSAQF